MIFKGKRKKLLIYLTCIGFMIFPAKRSNSFLAFKIAELLEEKCHIDPVSSVMSALMLELSAVAFFVNKSLKLKDTAVYKKLTYWLNSIGTSYVDDADVICKKLKKIFNDRIIGQENAKSKIIDLILGYLDNNSSGSLCIAMVGPSQTGKKMFANLISEALVGQKLKSWQIIDEADVKTYVNFDVVNKSVDVKANKYGVLYSTASNIDHTPLSPADQVFNENSDLIKHLKGNNKIIVFIKNIDRIRKLDKEDTILERLRDARDSGNLRVRKSDGSCENIDVSKTIFLVSSQENPKYWGVNEKDTGEHDDKTHIRHDISLIRRFNIVEFEQFKREDYEKFFIESMNSIVRAYSKSFNITIDFDENFIKKVSRSINSLINLDSKINVLRSKLIDFRSKNVNVQRINLNYDESNDTILLSNC